MKRQILIGLLSLMIFCVGSVSAQKTEKEKPNFSGIWNTNFSKSKFNSLSLMSKNDKKAKCSSQLIIVHTEPEIKFSERAECSFPDRPDVKPIIKESSTIFFTDSRGETNAFGSEAAESKSYWGGKRLVTTYYSTDSKSGKKSRSFINDYKISEDGKTLTRRFGDASTFGSPASRADFIFESKGIGEGNFKVGTQITVFNLEQ